MFFHAHIQKLPKFVTFGPFTHSVCVLVPALVLSDRQHKHCHRNVTCNLSVQFYNLGEVILFFCHLQDTNKCQ